MVNPAKEAQVIPIGIFFITIESVYIHNTIVIAVIMLGAIIVKPCADLAKLFEVTPNITANIKNRYE